MNEKMKALIYEGPRELHIREVEVPILKENEVLVQVAFTGICGSEISGYLGENSLRKPPLIMGHELSGVVAKIGSSVTKWEEGARVVVNPLVSCGLCDACLSGKAQLCIDRRLLGAHLPGSYAQYVKVPETALHLIPDSLSLEEAALVEPLACAARVAELSRVNPTDKVFIAGTGPIGLFVLQVMTLYGVTDLYVSDINPERLEMARTFGATTIHAKDENVVERVRELTGGTGVNVAVDAIGMQITRNQCIEAVSFGGKVIFTGLHQNETSLPINDMIRKEISTHGSFAYSPKNFAQALSWIIQNRISLQDWVLKEPLEKGKDSFERLLKQPGSIAKILLIP